MAFTYLAERTVIYWSEDWLKLSKEGWITYHVEQVEPGVTLAVMVLREGPASGHPNEAVEIS